MSKLFQPGRIAAPNDSHYQPLEGIQMDVSQAITGTTYAVEPAAREEDRFVTVPETTLPCGTIVPSFEVAKFLCSKGDDGKVAVTAMGAPWVRVNYHAARQACSDAGYKLLTELQAVALAFNASQQNANWTGGKVGDGSMVQGLHLGTVRSAQAGDYEPEDNERREFVLSNGAVVHDLAGNAYTWIFDDVQGDETGVVAKPFTADSVSISAAPYPSREKGIGWRPDAGDDWSGLALVRGGCWVSGGYAGVVSLGGGWPGGAYDYVGFRCTK